MILRDKIAVVNEGSKWQMAAQTVLIMISNLLHYHEKSSEVFKAETYIL